MIAALLAASVLAAPQQANPIPQDVLGARLRARAQELSSAGLSNRELPVLIELLDPGPSQARIAAARSLPRWTPADTQLRAEELALAVAELEQEVATQHGVTRTRVEALGGRVGQSLWLVRGFAAKVPAARLADLAQIPGIQRIHLDAVAEPLRSRSDLCNDNPLNPPFDGAVPMVVPWKYGCESQIRLTPTHTAGFRGATPSQGPQGTEDGTVPVVIAIADSGFDLSTDEWRPSPVTNITCWCPSQTILQAADCYAPWGVHGSFTKTGIIGHFGSWDLCGPVSRVVYAEDTFGAQDLDTSGDGIDDLFDSVISPECLYWDKGDNRNHYAHGTMVTALAAGTTYQDSRSVCDTRCNSGGTSCPQLGMVGVAPEADLQLYKIAIDEAGGLTTLSVEIAAVQQAVAQGAEVFNLSYVAFPDPNALINKALDHAATQHDLIICVAAGNFGQYPAPDKVSVGFFNGLIVGSVGLKSPYRGRVSPGSSFGPLAWPNPDGTLGDTVSAREGVNIVAPGGFWGNELGEGDSIYVQAGGTLPFPNESYSVDPLAMPGVWAVPDMVGTSLACPQVAGGAALVLDAFRTTHGLGATISSTGVRAVLLGEAADISGKNVNLDANHYGQGRLHLLDSTAFFAGPHPGVLHEDQLDQTHASQLLTLQHPGGNLEATLTWDRVVIDQPKDDVRDCSNLKLELLNGQGTSIATSNHPENNYERILETLPSGIYKLRISVESFVLDQADTTPPIPVALAYRSTP